MKDYTKKKKTWYMGNNRKIVSLSNRILSNVNRTTWDITSLTVEQLLSKDKR